MRTPMHVCSVSIVIGLILSISVQTAAQGGPPPPPTNILYGFIDNNRVLTQANPGPDYFVVGDVVVTPGASLTIEPGVRLIFAANRDTLQGGDDLARCELLIQGTLNADATSGDSIRFMSTLGGYDQWGQIKIAPGGQCILVRCSIRDATTAVNNFGTLTLRNASLFGDNNGVSSSGHSLVSDTRLDGFASALGLSGDGSVTRIVITGAVTGLSAGSFVGNIQECTIRGRASHVGYGLILGPNSSTAPQDSSDVRPSTVSGFGTGVLLQGGSTARNLLVYANDAGMYYGDNTNCQVLYCTSVGNSQDGIRLNYSSRVYCTISAMNGGNGLSEASGCQGYANYTDSWLNGASAYQCFGLGTRASSFNPFFVDAPNRDYHLSLGSVFKTYGPWGAEIGAYGPGPGSPTPATPTSWGRLKASYR